MFSFDIDYKKKRVILSLLGLIAGCVFTFAQQRSEEEALQIAQSFFGKEARARGAAPTKAQMTLVPPHAVDKLIYSENVVSKLDNLHQAFYVFNDEHNKRFVIVSGDERQERVLGYSENGTFSPEDIPCCMAFMLREYSREYDYLSTKSFSPSDVEKEPESSERRAPAYYNCILETKWGQSAPFNNLCNGKVAGCVAVAMAQIMYKHKYPSSYSWSNMLKTYQTNGYTTTQANAVAKLIRDCGISVNMDYGTDASSAKSCDAAWALAHKFGYNPNIKTYKRNCFPQSKWEQIILEELSQDRPIFYSGNNESGNSGHAFVLDGYDGNGFYHFNWGWSGSGVNPNYGNESYFKLTSLTPKVGNDIEDFTYDQFMVCQISPQTVGNFECVFYADKFIVNNFTVGNSFKVSFKKLSCYVTSANSFDTPFNGEIGIGLYNAFTGKGKLWTREISMKSGWSFDSHDYSFTISKDALPDGIYYLYPCAISGVSNGSAQNTTYIRTLNTQYDYYLATVKNGKATLTLKGTPSPDISLSSVTCENTNLSSIRQNDKLIMKATFKNMGSVHSLKSRLSICTKNSEGKLSSKYNSAEISKQIAYNEELTVKHELNLSNVPPGTYYATIMYYKDWDDANNWYYSLTSSNQYEIKVSEGGVKISLSSVTCENTNLSSIRQNDKLIMKATFKNMGSVHSLKSRLSICTKNSEGKLSSKYNSAEISKQIAYNEELTVKHELNLSNVPPGTYYATIMYYKDWDDANNWYYSLTSSNQYEIKVCESGVEINEINFPDANFRSILLQTDQGKDGIFSKSEINGIKYLSLDSKGIYSLKGVEHFTSLIVLNCFGNQLTSLDVSNLTELTTLYCSSNELTSLDLSKNTKLKELNCALNKIKGTAMDELIKSLPPNTTTEFYDFSVLAYDNTIDENVCTKEQAAAAKAKGWMPKFFDGTDWLEYEGSDDVSAINGIKMDAIKKDTPVYNLRGQRLTAPQKGINIIGGRKVVVK